jgi:hypothetical protein
MTPGNQQFPMTTGRDLLGTEFSLPDQFPAAVNIVVIAFQQWQQRQVDAWITALAEAGVPDSPRIADANAAADGSADAPNSTPMPLVVLEIPVLSGRFKLVRRFIDGGMAASIKDPHILARTITIYGSVDDVCRPLGITSRDDVSLRVVDRAGAVLWGCTGPMTPELVAEVLRCCSSRGFGLTS